LRQRVPENYAEIHPDTARPYGINDGEMMLVETKRGSIEIKARVTKDILPGAINMGHGWAKANCNILTSEVPCEPVFGYAALKALLCKIRKKT
jgi:formate dehydrogenase (coenzyme F420) alpha subunit